MPSVDLYATLSFKIILLSLRNFSVWACPACKDVLACTMLVNGVQTEPESEVLLLLEKLKIEPGTVAVLINGDVLPREEWRSRSLLSTDEVEIVKFVGGG